jgi:hypothetical protein
MDLDFKALQEQKPDPSGGSTTLRMTNKGEILPSLCSGCFEIASLRMTDDSRAGPHGLRMTNKGEILPSLCSGCFEIASLRMTTKSDGHEKSGEIPACAGNSPLLNILFHFLNY